MANKMAHEQKKPSARRRARECATQTLYAWEVAKNPPEEIEFSFLIDHQEETKGVDLPYFRRLFRQTLEQLETIDDALRPALDRNINELDYIERAVLRLATYELLFEQDVPYRVVINEAIEVAKAFGAEDSHKYINGVLDKIAVQRK